MCSIGLTAPIEVGNKTPADFKENRVRPTLSALENPTPCCYFILNTSTQELWNETKYSRMSKEEKKIQKTKNKTNKKEKRSKSQKWKSTFWGKYLRTCLSRLEVRAVLLLFGDGSQTAALRHLKRLGRSSDLSDTKRGTSVVLWHKTPNCAKATHDHELGWSWFLKFCPYTSIFHI